MRIQRARYFDTFCLAATGLFFGHLLDQNKRSSPIQGDSAPFLLNIRHFFFSPKKWKADSVEEVTALYDDSI